MKHSFQPVVPGIILILLSLQIMAQPSVDPFQVRYTNGFRNKTAYATPFTHIWAGSDIPLKLKERTYLLLSPYYEGWNIDSASKNELVPAIHSIAIPVGAIIPLSEKWTLNVMPIVRTNGEKLLKGQTMQFGGLTFATYAAKPDKKFRFGVYMNQEFFGLFVWPLLGTDWRLGKNDYLFALLPGRLTYEHQWNKSVFGGVTFRALTNSYRLNNGNFVRIDDNQLSLYLDLYPAKNWCITLEPGYGVARKIRTGVNSKNYNSDKKMGDGLFIKLSTSFRMRFE